jgi:hypothetical protein
MAIHYTGVVFSQEQYWTARRIAIDARRTAVDRKRQLIFS